MKNSYPELKVVPYQKTKVSMALIIQYLTLLDIPKEVKRAAYIFFRNESANGTSGINNNYGGFQADSGRWPERFNEDFTGVVIKKENQTGKERIFLAFKDWETSVDMLVNRLKERGLYRTGRTWRIVPMFLVDKRTFAIAYYREWVTGNAKYNPTHVQIKNFTSMYDQAARIWP